ncbi:hypothetical protein DFH09DRAFT_1091144 [Mycena vulgaris]|nr:hypothetical protein DFH09DRAFT_1091144 [Mycena vulgaris]
MLHRPEPLPNGPTPPVLSLEQRRYLANAQFPKVMALESIHCDTSCPSVSETRPFNTDNGNYTVTDDPTTLSPTEELCIDRPEALRSFGAPPLASWVEFVGQAAVPPTGARAAAGRDIGMICCVAISDLIWRRLSGSGLSKITMLRLHFFPCLPRPLVEFRLRWFQSEANLILSRTSPASTELNAAMVGTSFRLGR